MNPSAVQELRDKLKHADEQRFALLAAIDYELEYGYLGSQTRSRLEQVVKAAKRKSRK